MANLLATLTSTASSLNAYAKVLEVTQNNVANASTPGYAKQSLQLSAMQIDLTSGSSGGVTTGQLQSSRNEYAEQAVRLQSTGLGWQQQAVSDLTALQTAFDISGTTGIPNALNQFFQGASAWSQNPSSLVARQTVISSAAAVAQSFQTAANTVFNTAHNTEVQIRNTVDQVNHLVGQLQQYNQRILASGAGSTTDPGMDAQIHATLEDLSSRIGFSAVKQQDGTTTILLNGSTPLLVGDRQYAVQFQMAAPEAAATYPQAPATAQILASDGTNITAQTTDGQLGELLDMRNRVLPSYVGDGNQPGELNRMAKQFADRVNQLLTTGNISDGTSADPAIPPVPIPGVPLFTYDATNDTNVARTLSVVSTITPDQLAAISPGPPYVSNGEALALSGMATPTGAADEIDGVSYSEFYGQLAANVGTQLQNAQNNRQVQQSLVAQTQDQRQQLSGVSLDEEAIVLVEFQRAYQANTRFLTVLDQLTQDTIDILR